jgi:hypothetical protein
MAEPCLRRQQSNGHVPDARKDRGRGPSPTPRLGWRGSDSADITFLPEHLLAPDNRRDRSLERARFLENEGLSAESAVSAKSESG